MEAVRLNRLGEFTDALGALRSVARRIDDYAGSDSQLRQIVAELRADEKDFGRQMREFIRKRRHFMSMTGASSRTTEGQARR